MGRFAANGSAVMGTNVSALKVGGGTTVKASIYDLMFSCGGAPADQQFTWTVGHITTTGTFTSVTPQPLDADAPVAIATAGSIATAEPTYASVPLLVLGVHQRAIFRWVARERGELVTAKTASNGIGCKAAITSGTPTALAQAHWYE